MVKQLIMISAVVAWTKLKLKDLALIEIECVVLHYDNFKFFTSIMIQRNWNSLTII